MSIDLISAGQGLLAAEHAAVAGYRRLGPHLTPAVPGTPVGPTTGSAVGASDPAPLAALARASEAAHEQLRDQLTAALSTAGAAPVGPLPDYPLNAALGTVTAAISTAVAVEEASAAASRYLLLAAATPSLPSSSAPGTGSPSTGSPAPTSTPTATATANVSTTLRTLALDSLVSSAVRATRWRRNLDPAHATVPFPGL